MWLRFVKVVCQNERIGPFGGEHMLGGPQDPPMCMYHDDHLMFYNSHSLVNFFFKICCELEVKRILNLKD